eukprot:5032266-Pleurochrysis_carterae.AAC.1
MLRRSADSCAQPSAAKVAVEGGRVVGGTVLEGWQAAEADAAWPTSISAGGDCCGDDSFTNGSTAEDTAPALLPAGNKAGKSN